MAAGRFAALRWSLLSVCVLLISAEQKNITAESGQNVTLTCRAPNNNNNNNKTIVGVEWSRADLKEEYVLLYRDDFELYKQHPAFKSRVDLQDSQMKDGDVSLILKNVTTADSGRYEARVKMGKTFRKRAYLDGDPFCTFNLRVVPHGQKIITAESGQNVTLTCRGPNHNIIVVEWNRADLKSQHVFVWWDGQVLPEEQHQYFKNRVDLQDRQMKDGDVSVILKNVKINDAGTYECRVQGGDDSVELISIIYLRVVPPGSPEQNQEDGGKEDGARRAHLPLVVPLYIKCTT
ncbi:uncharacterized protein LOC115777769 isoform X1 [Archocentrus centrarchus]|uniref:uncharacterized protein LOC115777769 isoform X1 n=2 Tax=Archocentrus centrarchus TaxID=63155 RepID=UPI0011E9F5C3|nr:uncharacterized protein LOC115777769 isoform X1 [Archocentrus centrarchus]